MKRWITPFPLPIPMKQERFPAVPGSRSPWHPSTSTCPFFVSCTTRAHGRKPGPVVFVSAQHVATGHMPVPVFLKERSIRQEARNRMKGENTLPPKIEFPHRIQTDRTGLHALTTVTRQTGWFLCRARHVPTDLKNPPGFPQERSICRICPDPRSIRASVPSPKRWNTIPPARPCGAGEVLGCSKRKSPKRNSPLQGELPTSLCVVHDTYPSVAGTSPGFPRERSIRRVCTESRIISYLHSVPEALDHIVPPSCPCGAGEVPAVRGRRHPSTPHHPNANPRGFCVVHDTWPPTSGILLISRRNVASIGSVRNPGTRCASVPSPKRWITPFPLPVPVERERFSAVLSRSPLKRNSPLQGEQPTPLCVVHDTCHRPQASSGFPQERNVRRFCPDSRIAPYLYSVHEALDHTVPLARPCRGEVPGCSSPPIPMAPHHRFAAPAVFVSCTTRSHL